TAEAHRDTLDLEQGMLRLCTAGADRIFPPHVRPFRRWLRRHRPVHRGGRGTQQPRAERPMTAIGAPHSISAVNWADRLTAATAVSAARRSARGVMPRVRPAFGRSA